MTYPAINSRRIPYDIDGSEVGFRKGFNVDYNTLFAAGISSWLDSTAKGNLNKHNKEQDCGLGGRESHVFWFFLPEVKEITHVGILFDGGAGSSTTIQGSNDSTNGIDGTWETAVYTFVKQTSADGWRYVMAVSFSTSYKTVRIGFSGADNYSGPGLYHIHLYGSKADGQTPDDIIFTDANGNEMTALMDWGDQPEGTTEISSFKLKNTSTTKIANGVNLQLNHSDFAISLSQDGPWVAVLDITSIPAASLSSSIFVRNLLGPPLLTLGPKFGRCIVTVGSWT